MGRKVQHIDKWSIAARAALDGGASMRSATVIEWDVSGTGRLKCQKPVHVEYHGAEAVGYSIREDRATGRRNGRAIEFDTRCRRCPNCLQYRMLLWRRRARAEIAIAPRTWFGTLTVEPHFQQMAQFRASLRLARDGIDFHKLPKAEQFAERVREISPEITKWLKRVRRQAATNLRQKARGKVGCTKSAGQRCICHPLKSYHVGIRYILVVEEHTGGGALHGLPHFHLLVHEIDEDAPIRKHVMEAKWSFGITHFRLIEDAGDDRNKYANYVTKYLTKSILCRARASLKYGRPEAYIHDLSHRVIH